jgi:hypothetical protein
MAVDVARFGDDESVIGTRRGDSLTKLEVFNGVDVHALALSVKASADREKPEFIKVDVVGIGAGVADILRAWGYKAIDYIAHAKPWSADKHTNRRSESWFLLREKFRTNEINLPDDDILLGQLTAPKYAFDSAGRYKLEAKEDMKKRGLSSPDRADVVAMLFESDEDFDVVVAKDYTLDAPKKGTVEALLRELTKGEEEEVKWHTLGF